MQNSINNAKKTYYHILFETASDMKTTLRRINSLLNPNRSNSQLKLEVNDNIKTDSLNVASTLKTHFAEVAPSLNVNNSMSPDDPVSNIQAISNPLVFLNTDTEAVYKIILSFKIQGALLNEAPSFYLQKLRSDSSNTFRIYKRNSSPMHIS